MLSAVVLDIGNVVLELSFSRMLGGLGLAPAAGSEKAVMYSLDGLAFYDAYERGDLTDDAFLAALWSHLGRELDRPAFLDAWHSIFVGEVAGIDEALGRIAARLPLYALTNANPLHMEPILRYPAMRHFRRVFTSFELRARKPEAIIYDRVASEIGVEPPKILYVDDREENVVGARRAGYQAEQVALSAERLLDCVRERGINL